MKKLLFIICSLCSTIYSADKQVLSTDEFEKLLKNLIRLEQGINQSNNPRDQKQARETLYANAEILASTLHYASEQEEELLRDIIEKHNNYPKALSEQEIFLASLQKMSDVPLDKPIVAIENYKQHRPKSLAIIAQSKKDREQECQLCLIQ